MAEQSQNLPLLPLTSGVVLPGMVFTMALESEEARAAVEAAAAADGHFVLVPHIDGRYAVGRRGRRGRRDGRAARRHAGRGRARRRAGRHRHRRARHRPGPVGRGRAPSSRRRPPTRPPSWPASTGPCSRTSCSRRGAGRIAERLADVTEPGRIADMAGYSPDLTLAQKVEVLETVDVEERLRLVLGWARETLADLTLRERIKTDVEEGMEKTQREFLLRRQLESIRKELGQLEPGRRGRPRRLPQADRGPRPARGRPQGGRAGDRQAGADERAEPRARAGSAPGWTPCSSFPGASSPRTAST